MPLIKSGSDSAFRSNVADMIKAGHPRDVALAASFRNQRQYRAAGGPVSDALALSRAIGGYTPPSPSFGYREAFRQEMAPSRSFHAPGLSAPPRMGGAGLKLASGGEVAHALRLAAGGYTPPAAPFEERQAFHQEEAPGKPFNSGLVNSATPGRTDVHNLDVPSGSYVLPADIVSGLGEGNTMAGAAIVDKMMGTLPYGIRQQPHRGGGSGIPHPPAPAREGATSLTEHPTGYAHGGSRPPIEPGRTPIVAAGGEVIISPEIVAFHPLLGRGIPGGSPRHIKEALARGHAVLDKWVLSRRAKNVKETKALPGPAR
jgi:hypothetical protein